MRKFVLIVAGLIFGTPAFAADVVNGVDRSSQAYRSAYLSASADANTCNVNLFQRTGYRGGAVVSVVPLWDSNKVQAQACIDAANNGSRRDVGRGVDGGLN